MEDQEKRQRAAGQLVLLALVLLVAGLMDLFGL